jgi:hypothetical protein
MKNEGTPPPKQSAVSIFLGDMRKQAEVFVATLRKEIADDEATLRKMEEQLDAKREELARVESLLPAELTQEGGKNGGSQKGRKLGVSDAIRHVLRSKELPAHEMVERVEKLKPQTKSKDLRKNIRSIAESMANRKVIRRRKSKEGTVLFSSKAA